MAIGSPRGAIISTHTGSPGTQPISINVSWKSLSSCVFITARRPVGNWERRTAASSTLCIGAKLRKFRLKGFFFLENKSYDVNISLDYRQNVTTFAQILSMPAQFFEQEIKARLKDKRKLSTFLDTLVREHLDVKKIQLRYIFCTDEYLLEINKQFLNHNTLTDIITFDLSETENDLTGEIYISVERVIENAEKFNKSYNDELHRVIFHGALHLCGFKDKKEDQKVEMRRQEDLCIERYLGN